MITKNEIEATKLSVSKKDYYQVWNELLDTATKLSERWSPESTNESDPGIVLLKTLTAIADKLNYNIDKNTLETMMPSAAQEESIRKLCSMMGYNVKYYQSATTEVSIIYNGKKDAEGNLYDANEKQISTLELPIFTSIKNADDDVNFVTIEPETFGKNKNAVTVTCMEGQLIQCETDTDNRVTMTLIDDNYRYYLPEAYIAENGIFVYNLDNDEQSSIKHTSAWTKVDNLNTQSMKTKCYKFGFDSIKGLPYLQFPEDIGTLIADGLIIYYIRTTGANGNVSAFTLSKVEDFWSSQEYDIAAEDWTVQNNSAATNGANIETINKAYNNYKKTVGTFDTLVTCRDYMNKIYQLVSEEDNTTPLVSNCIASDIRDDINKAVNICTFSDYGLCYVDRSLKNDTEDKISHFDLILYPFKNYVSNDTAKNYNESFKYSLENWLEILNGLEKNKTLSHNIISPSVNDLVCIKVYYKLNMRINTTYSLATAEETAVKNNICAALYDTFNMRELEFGEKITPDEVLACIQKSDKRIKNVFLDTPEMYVAIQKTDTEIKSSDVTKFKPEYIKLAAKNILSGRVPLFTYNSNFKPEYTETAYSGEGIEPIYPTKDKKIAYIEPKLSIDISADTEQKAGTLGENEVIQFRAPSFHTETTYPAYVNYFIKLNTTGATNNVPAVFITLADYMLEKSNTRLLEFANSEEGAVKTLGTTKSKAVYDSWEAAYKKVLVYNEEAKKYTISTGFVAGTAYYCLPYDVDHFAYWKQYIKKQDKDIYRVINRDYTNVPGYLIDAMHWKYQLCNIYKQESSTSMLDVQYIPENLGETVDLDGIPENAEYTLQNDEYLFINYTQASSDDSGTKTIVQKEYWPGDIIKPNFKLKDSETVNTKEGKSWTKTDFNKFSESIPGMFTLDASQQIEIRKPTIVQLGSDTTVNAINVYWTMSTVEQIPDTNDYKKVAKVFKEGETWTLGDNEYFCYTDLNKSSMAYYGSGTIIVNATEKDLKLKDDVKEISLSEIATKGIAGIDWTTFWLDSKKYINIHEYQYINLVEDNQLNEITLAENKTIIDGTWTKVSSAKYTIDGKTDVLTEFNSDEYCWQVKSKLNLNIGPQLTQSLKEHKSGSFTFTDSLDITYTDGTKPEPQLVPASKDAPLSIKSNYIIQSGAEKIDAIAYIYNDDGVTFKVDKDYNLLIKTFTYTDCICRKSETEFKVLTLHNAGDNLTKITSKDIYETEGSATLSINIGTGSYGLIMFYAVNKDETWYLEPTIPAGSTEKLGIYNNITGKSYGQKCPWWTDRDEYKLRAGINIVTVPEVCTEIKIRKSEAKGGALIFSDLDIISFDNTTNPYGINTAILGLSKEDQQTLLNRLSNFDNNKEFYYNCPIEEKSAITINYIKDTNEETLADPKAWFDYNNIVNKFVIPQIDTTYLTKSGIVFGNLWKR